jgi:ATP-binding protein involved in chromosome partitioning
VIEEVPVTQQTVAQVTAALAQIQNPRLGSDLISAGMVRGLSVTDAGEVTLTFLLGREDPATLVREVRRALKGVDGVSTVNIEVADPGSGGAVPPGATPAAGREAPQPPAQPPVPEMPNLGQVIAVSSGKGGVGKSTVSANLAVALAQGGHRVGLMDADVYGPNVPRMFGVFDKPAVTDNRIEPHEVAGVKLMSLGFLVERDAPAIWRGPIIMKVVGQFLNDVNWGELDYFIVDLPPGTGDAQLSLVQTIQVSGALVVTTPQEMAVGDALRGAKMFERVNVPVLGVVENMSGFICPHCHERTDIFMTGGGQRLAEETGVSLLAQVPLQPGMADHADKGLPVVLAEPDSPAAIVFKELAETIHVKVGSKRMALPIIEG